LHQDRQLFLSAGHVGINMLVKALDAAVLWQMLYGQSQEKKENP
jgi:hypothetical protein